MEFIDLRAQYERIKPEIERAALETLRSGRYINGEPVRQLERLLAEYTGARHVIGVSSGTDALLVALMALDVGRGDEVVSAPFSFIASSSMIAALGAKPVFVDIDPETYNIDPAKIEERITRNTKILLPVSLYGQPADFDRINAIASAHSLPALEDAAQSFGAIYKGRHSGALSTIGTYSFFPAKPLGCYGDGGAVTTDSPELAEKIRAIKEHGMREKYEHHRIGINGRLDTIQAAVLIEKLKIFEDEAAARQRIAKAYNERLSVASDRLRTPHLIDGARHIYAQYTIAVEADKRASVIERLNARGIPTAIHYPKPLHLQRAFESLGYKKGDFPVAEKAADEVLSLPMSPYLTETDIDRVTEALLGSLDRI